MKLRTVTSSLIAFTLVGAPLAAQATPVDRSAAPAVDENELGSTYVWIILAIAAIVAAIVIIADDNDPVSP